MIRTVSTGTAFCWCGTPPPHCFFTVSSTFSVIVFVLKIQQCTGVVGLFLKHNKNMMGKFKFCWREKRLRNAQHTPCLLVDTRGKPSPAQNGAYLVPEASFLLPLLSERSRELVQPSRRPFVLLQQIISLDRQLDGVGCRKRETKTKTRQIQSKTNSKQNTAEKQNGKKDSHRRHLSLSPSLS